MSAGERRQLHLNVFLLTVGHHEAAWRLPSADVTANTSVDFYRRLAAIAERGMCDSLFLADSLTLLGDPRYRPVGVLEPTVLLAALSAATERIGLVGTGSTTYEAPYNLARRFASLDHVSGGRAGWNMVTTAVDGPDRNYGPGARVPHHERYVRATEFVEVAMKLWDSWEDDVVLGDKSGGVFADGSRIHEIAHDGEFFQVRGPLDVPRSPQGRPVLVQAGSSEDGMDFSARYAEAVFTAQPTLADAQAFYADLKSRAKAAGRDPDGIRILPGVVTIIGGTEEEAQALERDLDDLTNPTFGLRQLSQMIDVDLTGAPLDEPLPELPGEDQVHSMKSRYAIVVGLARRESLTLGQLLRRIAAGRGHFTVTGAPEQIADTLENWFATRAGDGFNIMPSVLPSGLEAFVDHVVPELQRRGLFRTEYAGTTLRDHFGLARPVSRYDARAAARR